MLISYAQNFEDVLLARAFPDRTTGFYIDVGAWHPTIDSVTKHFYDLGWHGINIEPVETYFRLLAAGRPRDINLKIALGEESGHSTIYRVADSGLSTFVPEFAANAEERGFEKSHEDVEVSTLRRVCEAHVRSEIDFLKIDVEGWERQVIRGGDWATYRPRVVLIEATLPNRQVASFQSWEGELLAAGYVFALFDGLNRFYVRTEDRELARVLSIPANYFDQFKLHAHVEAERQLALTNDARERLAQEVAGLAAERDRLAREAAGLAAERDRSIEREAELTGRLVEAEGDRDRLRERTAEYLRRLGEVRAERDDMQARWEMFLRSRSWRYTRFLREGMGVLRALRRR